MSASAWPAILIGALTLLVLGAQLLVFHRQQRIMDRQATIADEQRSFLEQQAKVVHDQAMGSLHRISHSLTYFLGDSWHDDPRKPVRTDIGDDIVATLRDAPRLFAPLGLETIAYVNEMSLSLRYYIEAATMYNQKIGQPVAGFYLKTVQSTRESMCLDLDAIHRLVVVPRPPNSKSFLDIVKLLAERRYSRAPADNISTSEGM